MSNHSGFTGIANVADGASYYQGPTRSITVSKCKLSLESAAVKKKVVMADGTSQISSMANWVLGVFSTVRVNFTPCIFGGMQI